MKRNHDELEEDDDEEEEEEVDGEGEEQEDGEGEEEGEEIDDDNEFSEDDEYDDDETCSQEDDGNGHTLRIRYDESIMNMYEDFYYEEEETESKEGELDLQEFEMSGIMSKLPIEIFFDILSRVDIGNLSECRWVSKAWYNTIKHPRFVKMQHEKVIRNNSSFILYFDTWDKEFYLGSFEEVKEYESGCVDIFKVKLPRPLRQIHSCNGLVFSCRPPYFVCNPITGEHRVVPKSPMGDRVSILTGFGYDIISQVYKVIRILQDPEWADSSETQVEVYNFRLGKWRCIHNVPYCFNLKNANVFVNCALHWIGVSREDRASDVIISFKLDSEEFQQLPLPPSLCSGTENFCLYLSALGGCLSLVHIVSNEHIEIWVMKEYGLQSSWVKEYTIGNVMDNYDFEITGPYKPIELLKDGVILHSSGHVLGYNGPDNIFTHFYTVKSEYLNSVLRPLLHMGSLVSPRSVGKLRKR
ncbi:hypothetical protein IFM89_022978 [Coptis chinensis]|uniref:F-box domain-containing protein n=1 Tax=Coptis chinensis TaxID=261450 RepID=A0A835IF98_9MAGN|nr:hypothetical protein IFM89_022978 [Coptis chinensis]